MMVVIALFCSKNNPIATNNSALAGNAKAIIPFLYITSDVAAIAIIWWIVAVVAGFMSCNNAIATHREMAGIVAIIQIVRVAIVALFACINTTITTGNRGTSAW